MSATETTDIKEVVKQKYGEAALRVKSGGSSCCGATPASKLLRSHYHQPLRRRRRPGKSRKKRCWPRSAAAIPRRSRN